MFKFFRFVRATFIDLIELIKNSSNFLQQKLPPLVASNLMVPNPNGSRFWFYVNESLKKITTLIMMKLKAGSYIICVGLGHIQSNELTHTSADLTDINKRVIQVLWLLSLDSNFHFDGHVTEQLVLSPYFLESSPVFASSFLLTIFGEKKIWKIGISQLAY